MKNPPTDSTPVEEDSNPETFEYQHNHWYRKLTTTTLLQGDSGKPPTCEKCGGTKNRLRMFRVFTTPCRGCGVNINLALVEIDDVEYFFPDSFTDQEKKLAAEFDVHLAYSPKTAIDEVENCCKHCGELYYEFPMCAVAIRLRPICNIVSGYDCYQCDQE